MYNVVVFVSMDNDKEKELQKQQEITLLQLKQAIKKQMETLQVFDKRL